MELNKCKCGKETLQHSEYCQDHWIEAKYQDRQYLDNSNSQDLGIIKWANDLLPEYLPQATPTFHIEMLMLLFSLLDPFYKNRFERQRNIISFRGSSKGQPLDSEVLTPDGWKTIGELKIGDTLYGSEGKPIKITYLHPITEMDIYEVETRDGRTAKCDEDHLWTVEDWCTTPRKFVTRATKELAEVYKYSHKDNRDGKIRTDYRFLLHTSKPIIFAKKDLLIEPYVLGLWLGDGHSANARITGEKSDLLFYQSELDKLEYFYGDLKPNKSSKSGRVFTMLISSSDNISVRDRTKDSLQKRLSGIKVLNNKHIPREYLYSSIEDRIALLQGLIDTDGCVVKQGGYFSYTTILDQLKDDFVFLVRSLGGTCTIRKRINKLNGKEFVHWTISSRVPKEIIPVKLPRKLARWKGSARTFAAITRIEKTGKALRRCISVDSKDGLYITNDFMLTHNSTLINFIFLIYILCHIGKKIKITNIEGKVIEVTINEKFIAIASETGNSAEDFAVRLRNELSTNTNLAFFYGGSIDEAMMEKTGQWSKRAFKYNKCFVISVGVGQQIRGKIKGASRPTFIICDDIYSENNVKTESGRKTVTDWFESAIANTLDDLLGKIVVVGTILHEDTVLISNKKSSSWKTVEYPLMPLDMFQKFVKEHLQVAHQQGTCALPYEGKGMEEFELKTLQRQYFTKIQEEFDWKLAWKERINLYFIALQYQQAIEKNTLGSLYQEYFHLPVSDEMKRIKPEYFRHMQEYRIYKEFGHLWFKCDLFDQAFTIKTEIGLDTGTGTPDGDESVATVAGILSNGYRVILKQIAGKYDLRDVRQDDGLANLGRLVMDRDMLKKIGILDEALRLAIEFNADIIKIGYAGSEKNNVTLLTQLAEANRLYNITVLGRRQDSAEGTKRERILNKIAPFYQSYSVIHALGLDLLEIQLQNLMRTTNDDRADSCFVAGTKIITKWGEKNIEDIKTGDKVLTPIGLQKVTAISSREAEVIDKFGFTVTPNHKFYNNNSFSSIDSVEVPLYFSKANIKEMLQWSYKELKYQTLYPNQLQWNSMGSNSGNVNRENIIFLASLSLNNGNVLKDFISTFGNILMGWQFRQAIMFITKILIRSIIILTILKLWKLKNIKNFIRKLSSQIKNIGLGLKNILQRLERKQVNGIEVQQEENGIYNITKTSSIDFILQKIINIFAWAVGKNIPTQNLMANIVPQLVGINQEWQQSSVNFVVKKKRLEELDYHKILEPVVRVVEKNFTGRKEKVYNIQVDKAGCYYANGILVSNCEVALFNMQQPFHIDVGIFKKKPNIRWKGQNRMVNTDFDWRTN